MDGEEIAKFQVGHRAPPTKANALPKNNVSMRFTKAKTDYHVLATHDPFCLRGISSDLPKECIQLDLVSRAYETVECNHSAHHRHFSCTKFHLHQIKAVDPTVKHILVLSCYPKGGEPSHLLLKLPTHNSMHAVGLFVKVEKTGIISPVYLKSPDTLFCLPQLLTLAPQRDRTAVMTAS